MIGRLTVEWGIPNAKSNIVRADSDRRDQRKQVDIER